MQEGRRRQFQDGRLQRQRVRRRIGFGRPERQGDVDRERQGEAGDQRSPPRERDDGADHLGARPAAPRALCASADAGTSSVASGTISE